MSPRQLAQSGVRALLSVVGREVRGMHEAAYVLAAFALGSQLLALLRDRLLAASFGASPTLDTYYAAFRIPDFLFATVASLLSLYALLPVLSRLEREHPRQVISFLRDVLLGFFVLMAVVCGAAFIFAPALVALVAPGFSDTASLVLLTRILLLQPILLGASNILANLTQLRHRFVLYSVSPLLYNIGIILGIVVLYPRFGLAGLGWGVVLGALMHLMLQAPYFASERSEERLPRRQSMKLFFEVLALSVPRTFSLAANQISLMVLVALASLLSAGSISVFMFAWNLQAVPLTIIGVSYSVAAFPTLSRLMAGGNKKEFLEHVETALRHIIFWSIPATVLVIVLRAQLVRTILGAGAFDWAATRLTAAALAILIISLLAQSASLLIARAYYAAGNTGKPLFLGVLDVSVSVFSAVGLAWLFHETPMFRQFVEQLLRVGDLPGTTVLMLALGLALGSIVKFGFGMVLFSRDFGLPQRGLNRLFFHSLGAALIGGAVAYGILALIGFFITINTALGIMAEGILAGLGGLLATATVLVFLKNPEIAEVYLALQQKYRRAPVRSLETEPALEPTDISS